MRVTRLLPALILIAAPCGVVADGLGGNRYSNDGERFPRYYAAEISASAAYIATNPPRGYANSRNPAVIIDVRTVEEYVGGHPPGAYSIPYPHVTNRSCSNPESDCHETYIGQDPDDFVAAVDALGLPDDALIITMCRTGARSVGAANLLVEAGYTNVQNMWEGFVGRVKQNLGDQDVDLDGGGIDYSATSGDLDGWANFAGLPVSYKLKHWQLDGPHMDLYYTVEGER